MSNEQRIWENATVDDDGNIVMTGTLTIKRASGETVFYSYARGYGQDVFPATTIVYAEQAGTGLVDDHLIAETAAITIPNLETDGLIACRLFRDGSHGNDTFTGNDWLHTIDLHYQADHVATTAKNKGGGWVPV